MANEWFIQEHGVETGPLSSDEIKQKASGGEIGPETPIRQRDGA